MANLVLGETPLFNRAFSAYKAGELVEAEQLCQQIIAARPDFFDAVYLLGLVQSRRGKKDAALASYDGALNLQPGNAVVHLNRANLLGDLGRYNEALAVYDRCLQLRPNFAEAHFNRGNVLQTLNRYDEAVASYDRATSLRPEFALAHSNRGNALQALKRYDEALASYGRALDLRPNFVDTLSNRGGALQRLKRYDEALASYERAISLQPDHAASHFNRGTALLELLRYDEALVSFDRALAARPDFPEAHLNRGNALPELKRYDEALASYERATSLRPDYIDAHYNEALCRLLVGDFDRGWELNEWRWQSEQLRDGKRDFKQPLWLGTNEIAGKTMLLHAEQGFGDTFQFSRYVPLVAERGARVILEVQKPLRDLMSSVAGAEQVICRGDPLPDFDIHCPLFSLPLAFGTRLETIPSAVPYLRASPQAMTEWEGRLGPKHRPRIGLAWSGRLVPRDRSIPLRALLSLLDVDATFVSLQKDVRSEDATALQERSDILHFGDALKDFSDTAAVIANLDLVISIDTSVANLAGALARPLWVMLLFTPDWRWMLDRDDSPWYPTARLFRQDATHAWDNVLTRVHTALRDFVQGFSK
jgi:tetratricopeptide (TPR) repeat protein